MARKPIKEFELDAFSGAFRTESDRACAVLGAALLDTRLQCLYKKRLFRFQDELLSSNQPLGTFSAKIKMAGALGWIDEDVRFDLDQIRSIRNEFAHNVDHELTFLDGSISDKCRTLCVAQTLIDAHEHAACIPHKNFSAGVIKAMGAIFNPPRQRFEVSVEMIAQHLDDLSAQKPDQQGISLRQQLWDLGSRVKIKVSMQGTVLAKAS